LSTIDGVQVVPLRLIADDRGAVFLMLKETDPHFIRFGEIYFSSVFRGVVKAWKNHRRLTSNYACIHGQIRLVLWDDRDGSVTKGTLMELVLGPDDYKLVVVPPGVWHGFQGLSDPLAIVANCATEPSDPDELDRLEPNSADVPHSWSAA
jgi:dTDP-4-dehydrorhamnose 3,5-epimerase